MTNKGQEYGREIAQKMLELQQAFRGELNTHNDIYADLVSDGGTPDSAAAKMAENEDFIREYLSEQVMELAKAVLSADWYGLYVAGQVPAARNYKEYRKQEKKQTGDYYHAINKTIRSFENFMEEHKNGII
jgi:hypothetical protein